MKKLSTKWFNKWAQKAKLSNDDLLNAIDDLEKELSVVDLGSNLFKIRVKYGNRGKSAGFRTIIVYRKEDRAIFLYGFAKNEKDNIDKSEQRYLKKLGKDLLLLEVSQLKESIKQNILHDLEGVK